MLGATTPLVSVLGAAPDPYADTPVIKAFARAACAIGLHLLLIEPYGKQPVDMRTSAQVRKDNAAARDTAQAEGRADWVKAKAKAGVYLATNDAARLCRYIDAYRKRYESDYDTNAPVNFAVAVGPSKLIVVDCDTAEQTTAFLTDAAAALGMSEPLEIGPTVKSPGQRDADGNWAHSNGGHFYFTVDEQQPDYAGSLTASGGYAVLWANRYVLIPPSVRSEGAYRLSGQDYEAPDWLRARVSDYATAKVRRSLAASDSESAQLRTAVDTWAESVPWDDLLAPAGWSQTARPDQCGCDIWTAPGDHASPKSATAHDSGCSLERYTEVNAPLHIWTDNPGEELEAWIADRGTKTLTKLQVAAALEFGGNVGKAMAEMGVTPEANEKLRLDAALGVDLSELDRPMDLSAVRNGGQSTTSDSPADSGQPVRSGPVAGTFTLSGPGGAETLPYNASAAAVHEAWSTVEAPTGGQSTTSDSPSGQADSGQTGPDLFVIAGQSANGGQSTTSDSPSGQADREQQSEAEDSPPPEVKKIDGLPTIKPFKCWRDMEPPKFVIDGLVEDKAFTALVGAPGVGKSGVVLDMAAAICLGRRWQGRRTLKQRVLYLPGEGMAGAVQRLKAWESAHGVDIGDELFIGDSIIQVGSSTKAWEALTAQVIELGIGLIIIDTFARSSVGLDENSATEVGKAIRRFDEVRTGANCGVMVVHHTGKSGNSARGSSALNGALDTELTLAAEDWREDATYADEQTDRPAGRAVVLYVSKQKNAAMPDRGIPMLAVPHDDSFVMTGASGLTDDPLDAIMTPPIPTPEHMVSVATRITAEVDKYPAQGITRSEIAYTVPPDAWTARRRDAKTAWRMKVNEAVDLALKYEMIQTLTGTASGARYVPGPTTATMARTLWASEHIGTDPDTLKAKAAEEKSKQSSGNGSSPGNT